MKVSKLITGITFSTFDLLHAGHVRMFEEAKGYCDYPIVGMQTDPTVDRPKKNKPAQSVVDHLTQATTAKQFIPTSD